MNTKLIDAVYKAIFPKEKIEEGPTTRQIKDMVDLMLPILVRQARAEEKIVFSDLAYELSQKMNKVHSRDLGPPLKCIGNTLQTLNKGGEEIPFINGLVVSQNDGFPGKGFDKFFPELNNRHSSTDPISPKMRKRFNKEYKKIFDYEERGENWDDVLEEFGLDPI